MVRHQHAHALVLLTISFMKPWVTHTILSCIMAMISLTSFQKWPSIAEQIQYFQNIIGKRNLVYIRHWIPGRTTLTPRKKSRARNLHKPRRFGTTPSTSFFLFIQTWMRYWPTGAERRSFVFSTSGKFVSQLLSRTSKAFCKPRRMFSVGSRF